MKYIISVDQSTSGTKVALYDECLNLVRSERLSHRQYYPQPGWMEHDAEEIWLNTKTLLGKIASSVDRKDIAAVGIANQRETTVLWERATGKPVCPAVVWQDVRAKALTDSLSFHSDYVFRATGLRLSPYYSAAKASAVLRDNPLIMERAEKGEICLGTVDSYLLYRLTGGKRFACDISNAGRTQLYDINTLSWSRELCSVFDIPFEMLSPEVLPSDAAFGEITEVEGLRGVPVCAMMGDSNSAFFAHGCREKGSVKASYGTGSSIMMNIGSRPVLSGSGLSTSVGFASDGRISYVLEGNVTSSADTLVWLRDSFGLISSMDELREAEDVDSTDGVYLVPAFSGLGAPWFEEKAKAVIYGMNRGTTKAHVIRAALASIAHQNADVLDAMKKDTSITIDTLHADGGGSVNPLLMQMQSDYVPCRVSVSSESEMTLYGAALMSALSAGVIDAVPERGESVIYEPLMSDEKRTDERKGWIDALKRCC